MISNLFLSHKTYFNLETVYIIMYIFRCLKQIETITDLVVFVGSIVISVALLAAFFLNHCEGRQLDGNLPDLHRTDSGFKSLIKYRVQKINILH